jgi:hypothetical protein
MTNFSNSNSLSIEERKIRLLNYLNEQKRQESLYDDHIVEIASDFQRNSAHRIMLWSKLWYEYSQIHPLPELNKELKFLFEKNEDTFWIEFVPFTRMFPTTYFLTKKKSYQKIKFQKFYNLSQQINEITPFFDAKLIKYKDRLALIKEGLKEQFIAFLIYIIKANYPINLRSPTPHQYAHAKVSNKFLSFVHQLLSLHENNKCLNDIFIAEFKDFLDEPETEKLITHFNKYSKSISRGLVGSKTRKEKRREEVNYIDEEAIMRSIEGGDGDVYGY